MRHDQLLRDAAQQGDGASERQVCSHLSARLSEVHAPDSISRQGVAKWFERGSIPQKWLYRIAALPKKKLDLNLYA